ncbi:unnamed protein product, partial [Symbiodinium microadriaticum]
MIHYNMPFVDDIRIIVDWTVVRASNAGNKQTSLWLGISFIWRKVEDAHTAFYRSRHVMFVRSQSYYAEEREKIYSGWAILCLVVLVILMPIIVFSPFSPFPNTVLIDEATLSLELTVASACYGMAHERELCRYVALQLFESPASQIQNYNSSAKQQYLRDNPRVNTDIDIQDVMWPWYSQAYADVLYKRSRDGLKSGKVECIAIAQDVRKAAQLVRARFVMSDFATKHFILDIVDTE